MRNRFDRQLLELNNELIQMGSLIEQAIEMGISALVKQDVEKAEQAIKFDVEVDEQEKTIESLCMKLLLQQQPVAKDLRLISAALKMITDMERIGDHAADISEMTILMADSDYEKSAINMEVIKEMAKETTDMVIKSVDAFVNKDLELARWVINRDDVVDDLFDSFRKELIQKINENVKNGEMATDMLMVAKYFERIGDHATNIAEWVGVSNIMLITVKERTREFGIRKALGAKPFSILWLIIVESVTITTLFGYIGMVAGIGVTEWMNSAFGSQTMDAGMFQQTMFSDPTVDLSIAIQATLTLIIAGTLAGFFPAKKAVSISPIEALRAD